MWFFVTRVRQLGCETLKARHLLNTTSAHAQMFDRCVSSNTGLERLFNHLSLSDHFNVTFELWHQCTCWTRQVSRTRHQSARPMVHYLMTCAITTSMRGFKSSSTTQCSVLRWNDTHRYLFILHNRMLDKASQSQNKNTSNHSHVGYVLCSLPF